MTLKDIFMKLLGVVLFLFVYSFETSSFDKNSDTKAFNQAYSAYKNALKTEDTNTLKSSAQEAYLAGKKIFQDKPKILGSLAYNYATLIKAPKKATAILKETVTL